MMQTEDIVGRFIEGGSEELDVREWINKWLCGEEPIGEAEETEDQDDATNKGVDGKLSSMLMRLQQESQHLNVKLEEEMTQMLASIPRALREVDRIGRDSEGLKKSLKKLENKVDQFDHEQDVPGSSSSSSSSKEPKKQELSTMTTLEHLHTIKKNLDKTIEVLEKSANWNRLVREVEENFASRDLLGVASRLGSLRNSLDLLRNMPDGERRNDTLIRMEQRLETLIGPGLRDAIMTCLQNESQEENLENKDAIAAEQEQVLKGYVDIFTKLNRLDHLCKDFGDARASFFMEDWDHMSALANENGTPFQEWSSRFFDGFLGSLEKEMARCVRVFGAAMAPEVIIRVSIDSFHEIGPKFQNELGRIGVEALVSVFEKTCTFSDEVLKIASLSGNQGALEMDWIDAIINPYSPFFRNYKDIEYNWLYKELETRAGKPNKDTVIGLLGEPTIFDLVEDGVHRCIRFSAGAKLGEYLDAMDMFWNDFISKCSQILKSQSLGDLNQYQISEKGWEEKIFQVVKQLQAVASFADRMNQFKNEKLVGLIEKGSVSQPQMSTLKQEQRKSLQHISNKLLQTEQGSGKIDVEFVKNGTKLSSEAIEQLVLVAQVAVYDTMLAPVMMEWSGFSRMRVWSVSTSKEANALGAAGDEETLSDFGGPLKYMTRVTKHLVTLVELLEPFASKHVSPYLLPKVDKLGEKKRIQVEETFKLEEGSRLMKSVDSNHDDENVEEDGDEEPDLFSPPWLGMVAMGAANSLLLEIVKIPKLGEKGSKQLAADLGYLDNVVSMIAAQDPILVHLQAILETSLDEIREAVSNPQSSPYPQLQQLLFEKMNAKINENQQPLAE